MWNKIVPYLLTFFLFTACTGYTHAQCFASVGNPVGGAENMGVMSKKTLRIMSFYKHHKANNYYNGDVFYDGNKRTVEKAWYNYSGMLLATGLTDRMTLEAEAGYFFNKTQIYIHNNRPISGFGFSNLVTSLKYALYHNTEKRIEWTVAAGAKIPMAMEFMRVDGVELPVDLQPSTASYGYVFQSYLIKENSFASRRFFLLNRYENNFQNNNLYLFGSSFSTAFFFSRHFVIGQGNAKDWTLILQARHQYQERNKRNNILIPASGSNLFILAPQINCSFYEKWNVSLMYEKIAYRYYFGTQLGADYSITLNLSRDLRLDTGKHKKPHKNGNP